MTFNPETRIWSSPPGEPFFSLNQNLGQVILHTLGLCSSKVVQIVAETDSKLTGAELRSRTVSLARHLSARGFVPDDVLALSAANSEHVAPIVFASLLLGAPLNCLDPIFTKKEYLHVMSKTSPKLVFSDAANIGLLRDCAAELGLQPDFVTVDRKVDGCDFVGEMLANTSPPHFFESPKVPAPTAAILCSSGTSGLSKPIELSHSSFLHFNPSKTSPNEVFLNFSSMYWLSGYGFLIHATLSGSLRIITARPFTPEMALTIIEKYRVTTYVSSPTRSLQLVQSPLVASTDLSSLRQWLSIGSILLPALTKQISASCKNARIFNFYGTTELLGGVTAGIPDDRLGYTGKIVAGVEAKIVDDEGKALPNKEKGELVVRKTPRFLGYYKMPEETRAMMDEEGWIRTGDMGYFEDDGSFFIVDRIKDVILCNNYWISPSELEDFIIQIDGVEEVVVVGLPHETLVDVPAALVVKTADSKITERDVAEAVRSEFADFKQLRGGVYFAKDIPTTPSGKVKRNVVKDMLIKMLARH